MSELIVSAPVLDLVRAVLVAELPGHGFTGVQVAENRPAVMPDLFVQIEYGADSGITDVVLDHQTLLFQVFGTAARRDDAERLTRYVAGLVRRLEGSPLGASFVSDVEVSASRYFPEPVARLPRWFFQARLTCRALIV